MSIDPYASEPVVELPGGLWREYLDAVNARDRWARHAEDIQEKLKERIGDAHAGTVNGKKVVTYRPTATYAVSVLRKAEPELTQHFEREVLKTEFDLSAFIKQHEDIAERYRSRSFRAVVAE